MAAIATCWARRKWTFDGHGGATAADAYGTSRSLRARRAAKPTAEQLGQLAGTYASDEAETSFVAAVEHGALVLKQRPDTMIALTPLYADAFEAGSLGTVIFRRDAGGRATAFSVVQSRCGTSGSAASRSAKALAERGARLKASRYIRR